MPLQNRVTPFGEITAVPDRGLFLGNRGPLLRRDRSLKRPPWVRKAWIICRLDYQGQKLSLQDPNVYTPLFFLDEATALAAGHRPCRKCRHADTLRFRYAWLRGNPETGLGDSARLGDIDLRLHAERVTPEGAKLTFRAWLADLPTGTLVQVDATTNMAYLVVHGVLKKWSPGGYCESLSLDAQTEVAVLTPRSIVNAIHEGYTPVLHPSAGSILD